MISRSSQSGIFQRFTAYASMETRQTLTRNGFRMPAQRTCAGTEAGLTILESPRRCSTFEQDLNPVRVRMCACARLGAGCAGPERSWTGTTRSVPTGHPMKSRCCRGDSALSAIVPAGAGPRSRSDRLPPAGTRQNRAGCSNFGRDVSGEVPQSGHSTPYLGGTTLTRGIHSDPVTVKVTAPRTDISAASRRNCARKQIRRGCRSSRWRVL
jgi:hypothetical protein